VGCVENGLADQERELGLAAIPQYFSSKDCESKETSKLSYKEASSFSKPCSVFEDAQAVIILAALVQERSSTSS